MTRLATLTEQGVCRDEADLFDAARDALGEAYVGQRTYHARQERHPDVVAAKAVCAQCPVRLDCLRWAYETEDRWSVLGGYTPRERIGLRRRLTKEPR